MTRERELAVVSQWDCPYCSHPTIERYDCGYETRYGHLPRLGVCDGCGGIVVLDVSTVTVVWGVRRVEGEGAAEEGGAMPGRPVAPLQVETDDAPTLAELPDEVVEQLAAPISESARAVLGPEHVVVEPLLPGKTGVNDYREAPPFRVYFPNFVQEVVRLERGVPFSTLDRHVRVRMVAIFGETLARWLEGPPTQAEWNKHRPAWMPDGSSIAQSYDPASQGWRAMSKEWFENSKMAVPS